MLYSFSDSYGDTRVGTDPTGTRAMGNRIGLLLENSYSQIFSGTQSGINGLFSGNSEAGIRVLKNRAFDDVNPLTRIKARVGVNASGTQPIPNGVGIEFVTTNTAGWTPGFEITGQVSGNTGHGVVIDGTSENTSVVLANAIIGAGSHEFSPLGNGGHGIVINGGHTFVAVRDSTIAWNRGAGIRRAAADENEISLLRNSFFGNVGLAVDLGSPGPTPNADPADLNPLDDGRIHTNTPVLTSARLLDGALEISGTHTPIALPDYPETPGIPVRFYTTLPTISGRGQGRTAVGGRAMLDGDPLSTDSEVLVDLDPAIGRFRFVVPIEQTLTSGTLITAAIEDWGILGDFGVQSLDGPIFLASEFSNILPVGSVLTSLGPAVDAGSSIQLFTGDELRRTVTFRDEDSNAFHITVDYGDGLGPRPADYRRADRSILLNHVYEKAGVYTVTVSVLDDSTPVGRIGTDSFQVTVQNTAPEIAFNEIVLTKRIREGETVILEGRFEDLGVLDAHTVEVNWGDGSQIVPESLPTGARTFRLSHRYDDDGVSLADSHVYRVVVTVRDEFGASNATPVFLVEVDNLLPSALSASLDQSSINEGEDVTLIGSFEDPGILDSHWVYINWGDGSPRERVPVSEILQTGTLREFSRTHRYSDNPEEGSTFTITVDVSDDDDPLTIVSTTLTVSVANVLPTMDASAVVLSDTEIFKNGSIALFAQFVDPGRETHTVTIDWGDGSSPVIFDLTKSSAGFVPFQIHQYKQDGTYHPTVSIRDRDTLPGDEAIASATIVVRNVAPVVTEIDVLPGGVVYEGDTVTVTGRFFDPSPVETYVVTIHWGDGTSSLADVNSTTRTFRATHRYLDDPSDPANTIDRYIITANINDGSETGLRLTQVIVQNAAPELTVVPVVDTSTSDPVLRALVHDAGPNDLTSMQYFWTLTKNGVSVPFTLRNAAEIQINPGSIPAGSAPLILTVTADDDDGGVATISTVLLIGTSGPDVLTVTNNSFPVGFSVITVLGLGGDDVLDASQVTDPALRVILFGGQGDDQLYDGAGHDVIVLGWGNDSLNAPGAIAANMGGDDEIFLIPNSLLTAYDSIGRNTLNFSLADSEITQDHGITFDLDLTVNRGTGLLVQDVAPNSPEADTHFVAALGTFHKLVGSHFDDHLTAASDSEILGGRGADRFFTKDDIVDVVFRGGDDADVLTLLGRRVARVRFDGDAGADELRVDEFAEVFDLLEFQGGDDADVFINRGRVSRVIFTGGADADVFQNVSGRVSRVRFDGDDGADQFINEALATIEWLPGDDPADTAFAGIEFDGGRDADVFINRGRVSRVIFTGGSDADVFQNQSGRITRVRFDGDDGADQFINEELASIEWQDGDDPTLLVSQGIEFNGGSDADVFVNRGRVSRVIFNGGADADVFQNQRGRITRVRFDGDDGADVLINEELASVEWLAGDHPALQVEAGIEFNGGDDADVFINRGRVSRLIFDGGADADVFLNQRGRITRVRFDGDAGDDVLINIADAVIARDEALEPGVEDGVLFVGGPDLLPVNEFGQPDSDADVFINRGRASRVIFTGGADADLLDLQAGEVTGEVFFSGGDDADVLIVRSRAGRVRFDGDAGVDEFLLTGTVAGPDPEADPATGDGVVEFNGGGDADVFVSRGTARRVIFRGGADDNALNVLQTLGGSIQELEFHSEAGPGILINRTNDLASLLFVGGNDADLLINRGDRIATLTFVGGEGDDTFVNSGLAPQEYGSGILTFDAGNGSNAMRNDGSNWYDVRYVGGSGEDFLQNNGKVVNHLRFEGGAGVNVLENNASDVWWVEYIGSDEDDILAIDGDRSVNVHFHAMNGNNTLINSGVYTSSVEFFGGDGADRFMNRGHKLSGYFDGGAGDDRVLNFGESASLSFVGGAGSDWWINYPSAAYAVNLYFDAGEDDDAADYFINLARGVSEVGFRGGAGDDLLLNIGDEATRFFFYGDDGDDVFENRGANGTSFLMFGGAGDDAFYQNAGFVSEIDFDGGDGNDTLLNFSNNVGSIRLIAGAGDDVLQNTGHDVWALELIGGPGRNTLQNFGHRVSTIRLDNEDADQATSNTLLNSGNEIGSIALQGASALTLLTSGNNVSSVQVIGSPFNDVVRVTGEDIQFLTVFGNDGDDSVYTDVMSFVGSHAAFDGGAGDDLMIVRGSVDSLGFYGDYGNDQIVFSATVNTAYFQGGSGDDRYRFVGTPSGDILLAEEFTGWNGESDESVDTLDFSSFLTGPISLDLAITSSQPQFESDYGLLLTLTDELGFENVIGTAFADTILGNARNNMLLGALHPHADDSGSQSPVAKTKTQWVYLNFHSDDDLGEYRYTTESALAVKARVEAAYAGFDVRFVLNPEELPTEIRGNESLYATIYFNRTPSSGRPGGEASEIDFGNINPGGVGVVQINGMLGGREVLDSSLRAVASASGTADGDQIQAPDLPKPESTEENFIALSAKLAAHELAHLLGLRHYDSFGPVGFGINSPPGLDRFKPTYSGIAAAFETSNHLISSPASVGTTRFNDLRTLYFGEREAIKLALAFSDQSLVRTQEPATPHNSQLDALALSLVTLDVPNRATEGMNLGRSFHVQAASVVGTIGLQQTTIAGSITSESDWYSFAGNAGDIVTIEVISRALKRYNTSSATSIDSVLRLYNAAGQLVQHFGADAFNDDEFESSDSLLMDVTLPAHGQYYIEVDTFRRLPGDASYEAAVALRAVLQARRDDADPNNDLSPEEQQLLEGLADSLDDTDTGHYELLMYRSSSFSSTDDIDILQGREGVDVLNGGEGDDYSIGLELSGMTEVDAAADWTGQFVFTDRGGFSWTATIDYGDGSNPVVWSPADDDRGQPIELSHIYATAGDYVVTVTVSNDDGLQETQTLAVQVHPELPTDQLIGFDVGSGMTQRSWINSLDLVFSSEQTAADLMAASQRIRLTRFGLNGPNSDGSGGTTINYGGAAGLSRTGNSLKLNFGQRVIGTAGRNSTAADGYYRLELDYNGDGVFDTAVYFYRLLGDVNGDRVVNSTDANLILAGTTRPYNRELDINGDGVVNGTDRVWTQRSNGRRLKDDLFLTD